MNKNTLLAVIAVLVIAGGMYWALTNPQEVAEVPTPTTNTETESLVVNNSPTPVPAAAMARAALATRLGIADSEIKTEVVEKYVWSDGCLGLGGPAESCIAAQVEGYRVVMKAGGSVYTYRTDLAGGVVRAELNAQ